MEKLSDVLKKIMLGILGLVMLLTLLLVIRMGLESISYLAALIAGAGWLTLFVILRRRLPKLNIRPRRAAAVLTLLCAAVSLAWVLLVRIKPFSDYQTYWETACALAYGTELSAPWYIAMYPHILGCSSFLSVFVRLFGDSVLMVTLINVALTCLSGLLIFSILNDIAAVEDACLGYLLWALCPCKTMLNSLVFSEPLYTLLILLFIRLILALDRRGERLSDRVLLCAVWGIALGLLLRAINIVRPIAAILIIALFIWLLLLRGKALRSTAQWKAWLIIIAAALCVYSVTGRLWDRHVENTVGMEPAAVPIYNIYVGFNEETQGQWSAEDMDLLFSYLNGTGLTPSQAQEKMLPHLRERLHSGIDFPRLLSSKLIAFLGNDELGGYTYRFTHGELFVKLCMVLCNVFYYGVFLAAMGGTVRMMKRRFPSPALLIPLFILGLTLAHMLVEVANRYHYSVIPMLIILAAIGLSQKKGENHDT